MISPFMSFRTEAMDPAKLDQVLSRYLAYQRLRWFRSRLIPRFAMLLLVCWGLTSMLQMLPPVALQTALILVGATLGTTLLAEFRARHQLVQELRKACDRESL
jgi:hypothetical protein